MKKYVGRFNRSWMLGVILGMVVLGWWYQSTFFGRWAPVWRLSQLPLNKIELQTLNASPVPFSEITIPFLRHRPYTSQLGELREISTKNEYTEYLTHYDSDGLQINALLTKPSGEPPSNGWPAIIFIHGYIPPTQYRTQEKYVAYVDYLANQGFVVLKIDLRGHGDSQGEPSGAYYSGDYVIDTLNAYAALQTADFVNPDKIGLWGHSMSGNIVLRSLAAKPDIPAAVIWAGAVYSYEDFVKYGLNDNSYRPPEQTAERQKKRQALFETVGQFSADHPFWQQMAATNYLNDMTGALQLHHAVDDTVVSVNYTRDLAAKLEQTQLTHEVYEYPQGGHNISGTSFTTAMQRTVAFFQQHLGQ